MPELALLDIARQFWPYVAIAALALLCWHFDARAVANADAVRDQASAFKQTQAAATTIAQTALKHEQAAYQAKATEAQSAYQDQLASAQSAADVYIAAHRVPGDGGLQPEAAAGNAGGAVATAPGGGAGVPAGLPADAVVVSARDVQACTDVTTYALKAHDFALSIAAASSAPLDDTGAIY